MKRKSVEERFWNFVNKGTDCWLWIGTKDKRYGHGKIKVNGKMVYAHRLSWEVYHDRTIPNRMIICHMCDVPSCVNPSHLFLGTPKDNSDDMKSKGRSLRGEANVKAVLTESDVIHIRETCNILQIAMQYKVSPRTILNVVAKQTWKHVM